MLYSLQNAMGNASTKSLSSYGMILFASLAVWADVVFAIPGPRAFSTAWFIMSALKNGVRIAFMCYLASELSLLPSIAGDLLNISCPRKELKNALMVALASIACAMLGFAGSVVSRGSNAFKNPLLVMFRHDSFAATLPFLLLSSISVGYAEELFFDFS